MRRRWVWFGGVIVVIGAVPLATLFFLHLAKLPPRTPPTTPPPGRPFNAAPVTYTTPTPTLEKLRTAVQGTNVVICVLDAARVDHFSSYGYPRLTTPAFDRLARESLLFEQHFCQAPKTKPSTTSLFTGLYPDTHGVPMNETTETLDPEVLTLEQAFAGAGYATYLLSANAVASPEFGTGTDFQQVRYLLERRRQKTPDTITWMRQELEKAVPQWQQAKHGFFAYLHVLPPHYPYAAPASFQQEFAGKRPPRYWRGKRPFGGPEYDTTQQAPASWQEWVNKYDANLRWADSFVNELIRSLQQTGLFDHTLLIITADHGEALLEHGFSFHPGSPFDEDLHIPLLIHFPGKKAPAGRVHALSQTIDLFPTLLELYGIPYPKTEGQGVSLLPLLDGQATSVNPYLVSRAGSSTPCYVIRDAHYTLLLFIGGKRLLYDMDADPWQTKDLYATRRDRAAILERAFFEYAQRQNNPPEAFFDKNVKFTRRRRPPSSPAAPKPLTDEQRRALEALGYLK